MENLFFLSQDLLVLLVPDLAILIKYQQKQLGGRGGVFREDGVPLVVKKQGNTEKSQDKIKPPWVCPGN